VIAKDATYKHDDLKFKSRESATQNVILKNENNVNKKIDAIVQDIIVKKRGRPRKLPEV